MSRFPSVFLLLSLFFANSLSFSQSAAIDQNSPFSEKEVRLAIAALEKSQPNPELAARHAWKVWRHVNQAAPPETLLNSLPKDTPIWMTWCTDKSILNEKNSLNCLHRGNINERNPNWSSLIGTARFGDATDSFASITDALSTNLSPDLVRSLAALSTKVSCKGGIPNLVQCLYEKENRDSNRAAARFANALPKNAVMVKANWTIVQSSALRGAGASFKTGLGVWRGVKSWKKDVNLGGTPHMSWAEPLAIHIDSSFPSRCPDGPNKKHWSDRVTKTGNKALDIKRFFFFEVCNEAIEGFPKDVMKHDFMILTGLHVATNLHPGGDWTWSTFYWHPDAATPGNLTFLSDRGKIINQTRPTDLAGWQSNYLMDIQYSSKEPIPLDPVLKQSAKPVGSSNPCNIGSTLPRSSVFNPYIEGRNKCGGYSNCIGCHSYAAVAKGKDIPRTLDQSFTRQKRSSADKDALYTHMIWTFARGKQLQ